MLETVLSYLRYPFMQRALVVGALVSLCAALLGVSLVLKRYSMIGDGLSHVGFSALTVAAAANLAPLSVAIPGVMVAAFVLLRINERARIRGDAAIALFSTTAVALGVMVISMTKGMGEVSDYMFGKILALTNSDVAVSIALCIAVLAIFVFLYHRVFAVTFDETFARATGTKVGALNTLLALLTAVTIVIGMRMMGTMLISSLIIFPPLTSMRVFARFRDVAVGSAVIAVVCFAGGILVSSYFEKMPAGACVVAVNALMFAIFSGVGIFVRRR